MSTPPTQFEKFSLSVWMPWADLVPFVNNTALSGNVATGKLVWYLCEETTTTSAITWSAEIACFEQDPTNTTIFGFTYFDGTNTNVMTATTTAASIIAVAPRNATEQWAHVMISVDNSTPANVQLYINDTELFNGASTATGTAEPLTVQTFPWPSAGDYFKGISVPALFMLYCLNSAVTEFWFDQSVVDWSQQSNRNLFHQKTVDTGNSAWDSWQPVNLGANGQVPLGRAPTMYMSGGVGIFGANLAQMTENSNGTYSAPLPVFPSTFSVEKITSVGST